MKLKMKIKTFVLSTSAFCFLASTAKAVDISSDQFNLEEARQFSTMSNRNFPGPMSVAQVPDEFDCPLFSNSPHKDLLTAIDSLQTAINIYPECSGSDRTVQALTNISSELRQKVIDAKNSQEKGEARKLGVSAEQIMSAATRLQDILTKAGQNPDSNCYKKDETKNLIFSINETFQSISPLALDFVAANPGLKAILAPYLPAIAGAKAISSGISVLATALEQVPTLDLTKPENRMAVIKNTCSFMKVYNKIEYLTLDRASRLKKINQEFDTKIRASVEVKRSLMASMGALTLTSNPTDAAIFKIKDSFDRYQSLLGKASDELSAQAGKGSEIGTCSVVKTVYSMKISKNLLADLVKLSELMKKEDQIAFKKTKLEEYESEINKADTLKSTSSCSSLGQEWLQAQNEALSEMKSILNEYENASQLQSGSLDARQKISREERKTADLQANKNKLTIFTDLSVFEPGELAKRMTVLPKFLFNGPDGSWYSKVKKNGPVYDLLKDNENSFSKALASFQTQISFFQSFEARMNEKEYSALKVKNAKTQDEFYKKLIASQSEFPHLSLKYLQVGSYDHKQLCDHSKMAIKLYVEATDHLLSNQYLCKMIDPALKETSVSLWLKKYCQNSKGLVTNTDEVAGYKQVAQKLFVQNGPKQQVEKIMKAYDQLSCD